MRNLFLRAVVLAMFSTCSPIFAQAPTAPQVRTTPTALSASATELPAATAPKAQINFVPFVIPWDDASPSVATDVSFLNAKPAGVNGYIVVKNGHFVEADTGRRVRFIGTNFTFGADFPDHADADKIAAHLAKLGVNIVRIHHEDIDHGQLWDKTAPGHTKFDPVAIDKLDYLIAQLKKNGIYVDLNLHVSRQFVPEDGFPQSVYKIQTLFNKRVDNIDRHMIDLQKKFASDYLTRVNPYTGLSYTNDPEVAIVEINNENSLVGPGLTSVGFCDSLPEPFRSEVVTDWNAWLSTKYRSSADIAAVWYKPVASTAPVPGDVLNSTTQWKLEDQSKAAFLISTGPSSVNGPDDVAVTNSVISPAVWHTQLHLAGLNLVDSTLYTLTFRAKASSPLRLTLYASQDEPDWHHIGLDVQPLIGTDWAEYRYTFMTLHPIPDHSRISFELGASQGTILIQDIKLSGATSGNAFGAGSSLETHNIDIPTSGTTAELADWTHFIVDAESSYADEMRAYLRNDLKVHANVIDTQMTYGGTAGFKREAGSDFEDIHAYWQQPAFPGIQWDQSNWTLQNIPMTDALASGDGGVFGPLVAYRLSDKPYTISEYNCPAPNDFQAEMYPEIASYAAYQDWDAIFEFDYGNYGTGKSLGAIQGFFAMGENPAKEGFLPAAALIFRGGEISPAAKVLTLHLPSSAVYDASDAPTEWTAANHGTLPGLYSQRFETVVDSNLNAAAISSSTSSDSSSSVRAVKTSAGSQYLAVGSSAAAAAGFVGGETVNVGQATFAFPTFGNNFASLSITSIDQKPVGQSEHLLLTIAGKAENVGVIWNAARTSVGRHWGPGPAQAEGIPATVTLANGLVKHVWALDPTGARKTVVPVTLSNDKVTFDIGPQYQTIWYEIGK